MQLEILENSINYTAQIVSLPVPQPVEGLDNLVRVVIFGNACLIGKDTNFDEPHIFFPAECQLSADFLSANNLYRHSEKNFNPEAKGFFEDNGRVKAMKFKGVISSGFVTPVSSLLYLNGGIVANLKIGQEFNDIITGSHRYEICKKFLRKVPKGPQEKIAKLLDEIIDSRLAPEHPDTEHLLRNVDKFTLSDYVAVTVKLHGTSARYYNTLVKRQLAWYEKLLIKFGIKIEREEYAYVCASRRVIKSVRFKTLDGKSHWYETDIWSHVGEEHIKDKLNKGEAIYCEIIGKDYSGADIQSGYSYGLEIPKIYVYRISNISPQGIEIDLPYHQMKERADQLGLAVCPELFYGTLEKFIDKYSNVTHPYHFSAKAHRDIEDVLSHIFYDKLLEQPSLLDNKSIEEGFCLRKDIYPKPYAAKIKARSFLLHESGLKDKDVVDIEEEQVNA